MLIFSIFEKFYEFATHTSAPGTVCTEEEDGKGNASPNLIVFALSGCIIHWGPFALFTFLPLLAGKEAALPSVLFSVLDAFQNAGPLGCIHTTLSVLDSHETHTEHRW